MQISKINYSNFKGLWEAKRAKLTSNHDNEPPVYHQKLVYHPFSDEAPKEVREEMKEQKKKNVWAAFKNFEVDHYVVTNHVLGTKLNITKKDYEKLQSMSEAGSPVTKELIDPEMHYVCYDTTPTDYEENLELLI